MPAGQVRQWRTERCGVKRVATVGLYASNVGYPVIFCFSPSQQTCTQTSLDQDIPVGGGRMVPKYCVGSAQQLGSQALLPH